MDNTAKKPTQAAPETTAKENVETARQTVIESIATDARKSPERWLRDAEVPSGGE